MDQGGIIDHRKVLVSDCWTICWTTIAAKAKVKTCKQRDQKPAAVLWQPFCLPGRHGYPACFRAETQAQGVKDSTINRDIAALKRAFSLGHEHSPRKVVRIPRLPMAGPESKPRENFFTHEEFLRVRSELPADVAQLVTFLYYTGCRKGEAQGLQWKSVTLAEGKLRLTETKTAVRVSYL